MRHVVMFAVVLLAHTVTSAAHGAEIDARSVAERYAAAAMAGEIDAAGRLAVAGGSAGDAAQIKDFRMVVGAKPLEMKTVLVDSDKGRALAVTGEVKIAGPNPDGQERGFLLLELVKVEGQWFVEDVDFRSQRKMNQQLTEFRKRHPGADEIPVKR